MSSALYLFANTEFAYGIMSSSGVDYKNDFMLGYESSLPCSNHLLDSHSFTIHVEGDEVTRTQKVALIKDSPIIMQNLRVCYMGDGIEYNCGKCSKCIRSIFNFYANG